MSRSLLVVSFLYSSLILVPFAPSLGFSQETVPAEEPASPEPTPPIQATPAMEPASNDGLFEKGLDAYQKKQFAEARDAFQRLLETSSSKPRVSVLHNLALSEFQLGQKPRALAMWRKALSDHPDFKPAQQGRDFLESQSSMRPFERDSVALWQRRALEQLSIYQILCLEALLIAVVGTLGIRYFSERRIALDGQLPLPPFPTLAASLTLVLILSTGVIGLKLKDGMTTRATVVVNKANVRSLPTDESVSLFELSGGTELLVRRINDGWVQIQNSEGASGWVKSTDALITSQH